MSVKRYIHKHLYGSDGYINESLFSDEKDCVAPEGEYVLHSDYAVLLAENARLVSVSEAWKKRRLDKVEAECIDWSDYEKLKAEREALLAATQWQPIETATWDNLRKHMVIVLITKKRDFEIGFVEDWAGQLVITNKDGLPVLYEVDDVTHWMPLPKPPCV